MKTSFAHMNLSYRRRFLTLTHAQALTNNGPYLSIQWQWYMWLCREILRKNLALDSDKGKYTRAKEK